MRAASIGVVVLVVGAAALPGESRSLPHFRQVASMRPADSLKVLPLPEAQKSVPVVESQAPPARQFDFTTGGFVVARVFRSVV